MTSRMKHDEDNENLKQSPFSVGVEKLMRAMTHLTENDRPPKMIEQRYAESKISVWFPKP